MSQRFREQRLRRQLLSFQVGIKHHRQVANKNASEPCRANLLRSQQNQSVFTRSFQPRQLLREVSVEVHTKFPRDLVLHHHCVAKQSADHCPPQSVLLRQPVPAHRRHSAIRTPLPPRRKFSIILPAPILHASNRPHAHAV